MKRILYFLIGFCIPLIWFNLAYSADYCSAMTESQFDVNYLSTQYQMHFVGTFVGVDSSTQLIIAIQNAGGSTKVSSGYYYTWTQTVNGIGWNTWCYRSGDGLHLYYGFYSSGSGDLTTDCAGPSPADSDGDGIGDDFDLKPDSSEPYKAAIVSVCYDENNKVVAGVIQDEEGNQYSFGALPKGEDGQIDLEGYTITNVLDGATYYSGEELSSKLQNLDIDDLNITKYQGATDINPDGTFQFPDGWFDDYWKEREKQTKAPEPDTSEAPSEKPDPNDNDSGRLDKIIKNTDATNTNLKNIQGYLRITNDLLAKIKDKTGTGSSSSSKSGGAVVTVKTPSADEIGQAVEDNLIDSGQTIDTTITDNIPALDETDTLTAIKTKYSDRYDLFITTVKESDLFSLPFDIFAGPSGSGSSVQTVDIGKWGSSSEQTATIDYSDYDNIWAILRSVLLLVTSFACFKILVLKKA